MLSETKKNLPTLLTESLLTSEQHKAIDFIVNNDKGVVIAPTGVGKTEVAKQLAYILGVKFLRFDMSEYSERHTV